MNNNQKEKNYPYFRGTSYIGSYPNTKLFPVPKDAPLIAFMGRSNSGKSSLISAICDHKNLAKTSKTAGKTKLLSLFRLPAGNIGEVEAYFIDTPGYGYAEASKETQRELGKILNHLLSKADRLTAIVLVLDARRSIREEEAMIIDYCSSRGIDLIFVRTRWDTMNNSEKNKAKKIWKEENIFEYCIPVSSTKKTGLDRVTNVLKNLDI